MELAEEVAKPISCLGTWRDEPKVRTSVPRTPEQDPEPYWMFMVLPLSFTQVEEALGLKEWGAPSQLEPQVLSGIQVLEDPVSKISLKGFAGVPTLTSIKY